MSRIAAQTLAGEVATVFQRDDPDAASKTSEQANLLVIQRLYEAFMRRDVVALLDDMAEDVEWNIAGPSEVPFTGADRGRGEVARVLQKSFATVQDQQPEVRQVVAEGDQVKVHGYERGTHQPTGNRYETAWVHVFTLSQGKVVRFHEEFESAPILEAMQARTSQTA
jgi:ketosteroid isomerase-like protein